MAFAQRPESDARRNRHQRFFHQQLGELERPQLAVPLRQRRPQEHGAAWLLHRPSSAFEPRHQHVAPLLIHGANLARIRLALAQRDNRRDLNRLKHAVIQVALNPRQRRDHLRVAQAVTHPPARHVVALRHGKDLDRDLLGAIHLQNAGRTVTVETKVGIREIVDDHGAVRSRQPHHFAHEIQVHAHRGRIVREANQQHLGLPRRRAIEAFERVQERRRVRHRQLLRAPFRHNHAVLMDRVRRVRRNHHIARTHGGEQQVGQRILGADGDDGVALRVQLHAVISEIALGDFLAQLGNSARLRVAMVARVACGLHQFRNHHARRSPIRVAHPQVDDVDLGRARLGAHLVNHRE